MTGTVPARMQLAPIYRCGARYGRRMGYTDLAAYGRMLRLAEDAMLGKLLAWRDNLTAAVNVQPESIVFLVPERSLPGVETAFGSRVIHADVTEPMVALAVPKLPV